VEVFSEVMVYPESGFHGRRRKYYPNNTLPFSLKGGKEKAQEEPAPISYRNLKMTVESPKRLFYVLSPQKLDR